MKNEYDHYVSSESVSSTSCWSMDGAEKDDRLPNPRAVANCPVFLKPRRLLKSR